MLLLGVGDPAERAAEIDPDPLRGSGAPFTRPESTIRERKLAGDETELAEPIELAGGLRRHPRQRIEVVDLGGDLRAERRRIEPIDTLDGRLARSKAGSERLETGPGGGDDPDPGDPDATAIGAHVR